MDVSIINKKCMATVVCVVLSLWQFPAGLCIVAGLVTMLVLLARRNKRVNVTKPMSGPTPAAGMDPATMLAAIMGGGAPPASPGGSPRPPRPSRPATKHASTRLDPFA